MKFHQNCRVLSNVLRGSTSRFKVEARVKSLEEGAQGGIDEYDPNIGLIVHSCIIVCWT